MSKYKAKNGIRIEKLLAQKHKSDDFASADHDYLNNNNNNNSRAAAVPAVAAPTNVVW